MKPISVRFAGFGPYLAEQFVDFTRFEQSGLFLICGETGSGKTTILDAMCYALYGKSSGGLRGDMEAMRCELAGPLDETRVEFVFDSAGKRYKFTRALRQARAKLEDEHNCMVYDGGDFRPIFANPKKTAVNKKAEEIIGLSYEQFCQVIILPQGQFERLLVSDSKQKEAILSDLFHAERWSAVVDEVCRRVSELDAELKNELAHIAAALGAHGCKTPEELSGKIAAAESRSLALAGELQARQRDESAAKIAYESALVADGDFIELDKREKALLALASNIAQIESEESLLRLAEIAESITPAFTAYKAAEKAHLDAQAAVLADESAQKAAAEALERRRGEMAGHEADGQKYEYIKSRITLFESSLPRYMELEGKKNALKSADGAEARLKKALDKAVSYDAAKREEWLSAMEAQKLAMDDYAHRQAAYLQNIGGVLAARLKPGQPCPVCGSREHPSPAAATGEHVSESELDLCAKAMREASDAVTKAAGGRREAEKAKSEAMSAHAEALRRAMVALSEYNSLLNQRIPGIDTEERLREKIKQLRASAADYEARGEALKNRLTNAASAKSAADGGLAKSRAALVSALDLAEEQARLWKSALSRSRFETEAQYAASRMDAADMQKRRAAAITFRANLAGAKEALDHQREKLKGRRRPDTRALKALRDEAESAVKDLSAQSAVMTQSLAAMRGDLARAEERKSAHDARRASADANMVFANRLRGRSGLSLQRYVLGVMLTSIATAANQLLKTVHGGRYQLLRTDEVAGHTLKSGLELAVLDAQSNKRRSVVTLSGGEKFLVALSLAIGLSSVVQAQRGGIRIEAMFIDEGFGSLDQASIGDALDVLGGVRRANGLVGIISHVERLKETIPSQIEIIKGKDGSRCAVR